MNDIIIKDLFRYEGKMSSSLWIKIRYFIFTPGFRYTFFFRKASHSRAKITKLFWSFLMRQCMLRTGIQIPVGTNIGPGLKIGHFGAIVINPFCKIGSNFNIAQGCLIGNSGGKRAGVPEIGDNVVMGANSIVIGNCHIGNNVLIAPGAFVNFNVPDNSIVIGNPGVIIPQRVSPTTKYIVYPI